MLIQTVDSGYKQTELGRIPPDWCYSKFEDVMTGFSSGQTPSRAKPEYYKGDIPWITSGELDYNIIKDTLEKITPEAVRNTNLKMIPKGTFLFAITGLEAEGTRGSCAITGIPATTNQSCMALYPKKGVLTTEYLFHFYVGFGKRLALKYCQGTKQQSYTGGTARFLPIIFPPTVEEQAAIVQVLSDTDALIRSLDKLIEKKRGVKRGAMQELLTGRKRLPGFEGEWQVKTLLESTDCLDNLRVPLNETQRMNMKGEYPYCGANGILDYINDFMIDDDIILIAEDGGYFDEYQHRPIAYRMKGKCWVNNHAHVLKAKENFSQDYIFYSLVHKNILRFLTGGTRSKLNKTEMYNIEIRFPPTKEEQTAIGQVLSDMDAEIETLVQKRKKYKQLKVGMMQQLLTGRIRLN